MKFAEKGKKPKMNSKLLIIGLLFLFWFSACEDDSGRVVRIGIEEYSKEEQKIIGDNIHDYIHSASSTQIILSRTNNPQKYDFVNSLFNTAIKNQTLANMDFFDWSIDILYDDAKKTAFALPGGHIYVYSGLLEEIDTDSELFYLLTHEIAYTDLGMVAPFLADVYGNSKMGDVFLNNEHAEYEEMVETLHKTPYSFDQVTKADAFQALIFCENNFNFNSLALYALIEKGDKANGTWDWFKTRANYSGRTEAYEEELEGCE